MPIDPSGRRPLKTRGWPFFQKLAAWLARTGVTPNAISFSSMVFGALAGLALVATSVTEGWNLRLCFLAAAACIQLRLIANLLDGMVAVEGGKGGPTGDLWNEAPDRVADVMILIGAGFAAGSSPTLGMIASLVAVFVAYVRALGASVGAGQIFLGPMAKPHRMFVMTLMCLLAVLIPPAHIATFDHSILEPSQLELRFSDAYYVITDITFAGFSFDRIGIQLGFMSFALLVIIIGGAITSVRRLRRIAQFLREKASV